MVRRTSYARRRRTGPRANASRRRSAGGRRSTGGGAGGGASATTAQFRDVAVQGLSSVAQVEAAKGLRDTPPEGMELATKWEYRLVCLGGVEVKKWVPVKYFAPKSAAREKQKRHKRRRMSDAGADGDVSRTRSGRHRTRSTRRGGGELFKLPEDWKPPSRTQREAFLVASRTDFPGKAPRSRVQVPSSSDDDDDGDEGGSGGEGEGGGDGGGSGTQEGASPSTQAGSGSATAAGASTTSGSGSGSGSGGGAGAGGGDTTAMPPPPAPASG